MGKNSKLHLETLAIHVGQETPDPATDARAVPIYQTTSYVFRNSQHAADRFGLRDAGNIYGRLTNSTQGVFEDRIAALEGGVAGLAVASGAAAVTYALQNVCQNGDHIVAADNLYGGSYNLITHTLTTQGVDYTIVNVNDLQALEAAIRPNTKVVYAETLGNPNSEVTNLDAIAEVAHRHGVLFIVDNTFAPILVRPIEHGADVVVHSATKYLNGHGDVIAGFVCGKKEFLDKVRGIGIVHMTGAVMSPFNAFLISRGLKTLSIRMDRHCENAMKLAKYLESHPAVAKVYYPGLESFEGHEVAKKQMSKFGGMMSIELKADRDLTAKTINKLKLCTIAVSLGDAETLVEHAASMTHSTYSPEELAAAGIPEGLVRISVGLEDVEDIIADFEQAFADLK